MQIRNYLFFFLILLLSFPVKAQNFITLKWQAVPSLRTKASLNQQKKISFDGAQFIEGSSFPRYIQSIDLGTDYALSNYNVKIEYPEFQKLTKIEVDSLKKFQEQLPSYPQVTTQLHVSAKRGILEVSFIPLVYKDGVYQRISSFKIALTKGIATSQVSSTTIHSYAANSQLSSGKWVKIRVSDSGVYKITNSELLKMGFTNPAKVRLYGYGGLLLSEDFSKQKPDDLPQIPLWRETDYVLFYANGTIRWTPDTSNTFFTHTQNHYSGYSYYFLTESDEEPLNFPVENLSGSTDNKIQTFDDYALYEKDAYSWTSSGRELYEDYDYASGNIKRYTFTLPGITNDNGWVTADFSAKSSGQSTTFNISVNGTDCGTGTISPVYSGDSYTKAMTGSKTSVWEGGKDENTVVTITHTRSSGVPGRLNYIRLNYKRSLALYNSYTFFRSLSSIGKESTFVLSSANENTRIWDITTPGSYKQIEGTLSNSAYSFTIPAGDLHEFVAVDVKGSFKNVEVVGTVPNQNLHAMTGVDMVIITPPDKEFTAQAERLAKAHREKDGLTVSVVTSEQVYNEFSSGTPDATAYRWLMKMLYDRASSQSEMPKYLLLFGNCAWDNRMITSSWKGYSQPDFLLCFESYNSTSETSSYVTDDYFGFLDDSEGTSLASDKMDIGVGRLPVRTVEQAKQMVDKVIAYMENKEVGPWKNVLCFAADDGDNNLHMEQAEVLAKSMESNYPEFLVNRVYLDSYKRETTATGYTYKLATKRLLELLNQGLLVVNYTGHGSATGWAAENLLTSSDITELTSPRLSLWVTATCDFARFDDVSTSAGELAFLNSKGGAIGLFTTSRVVYASQNSDLNVAFNKYIFAREDGKRLRLGDIMRKAKCESSLSGDMNKLNFSLIGDPALTLAYPDYKVVVDEFNNQSATADASLIKAGSKVTVKGRVLNTDGTTATDFNGFVHPTVLDNEETVTTLGNESGGVTTFTYKERTRKLFAGSDSIKAGSFNFTFPVPVDINYSNQSGMLNLYASGNVFMHEGQGAFSNFLIGGTADSISVKDTLGPKISLYLNTPDFVHGGKTNETPFFVATLEDSDGINTVGNGIGHDIMLVVDNSSVYSYVLNNYYEAQLGDYTKGEVRYTLPELTEGKHKLLFRAWDVQNNSSSANLEFEVVKGLKPMLFSVDCTKSPAHDNTTFILTHDRPETELEVCISVFDFTGRELWSHTESGTSATNYYYVDWDLTSSSGQRLSPGVYLFRATISAGGSKESTKARKIVVLAQ